MTTVRVHVPMSLADQCYSHGAKQDVPAEDCTSEQPSSHIREHEPKLTVGGRRAAQLSAKE